VVVMMSVSVYLSVVWLAFAYGALDVGGLWTHFITIDDRLMSTTGTACAMTLAGALKSGA
jgi:hypothetical protein